MLYYLTPDPDNQAGPSNEQPLISRSHGSKPERNRFARVCSCVSGRMVEKKKKKKP